VLRAVDDEVRITVRVQPRARRSGIEGTRGDALKVRLTAPPVDGAANEALIALVAETLGVSRGAVRIVAGATGRDKVVGVRGVTVDRVRQALGV
jgi:uncharacterized protein